MNACMHIYACIGNQSAKFTTHMEASAGEHNIIIGSQVEGGDIAVYTYTPILSDSSIII